MGCFSHLIKQATHNSKAPQDLWFKCPECSEVYLKKKLEENLKVCPHCDLHMKLRARDRVKFLFDEGTFTEETDNLTSLDSLHFSDSKPYPERISAATEKSGENSAVLIGQGKINGIKVASAIMDFGYLGGSMGSVVGEKIARIIERATLNQLPLLLVTASGGARMQEGILSLMQMAKTSAAIGRHHQAGLPSISLLTDPTTGGTTASFATLPDILIAEPKALICFAGPRVIEQTIHETLPEGFQRSEYLLKHGMLDAVIHRSHLKKQIADLFRHMITPFSFRKDT
jgi:acetyl-CoA carboxylase carboxyl transferase subunit beta